MKVPFATFVPMHNEIRKDLDKAYNWTAIRQVDTKNKPRCRIARHYAALLRISNGVRPFFISMRW